MNHVEPFNNLFCTFVEKLRKKKKWIRNYQSFDKK